MFSLVANCCCKAGKNTSVQECDRKKMYVGCADIIVGLALIIIGALSITGIIPGAMTNVPGAVLIAFGGAQFLLGSGCTAFNRANSKASGYNIVG